MLVRLLQTFDRFELDASAQPPETIPPASWKDVPGRQSIERCWPKAHLTLYANVSRFSFCAFYRLVTRHPRVGCG